MSAHMYIAAVTGEASAFFRPLGRAFLTGAIRNGEQPENGDCRRLNPCFQLGNLEHNRALVQKLAAIAAPKNCTLSSWTGQFFNSFDHKVVRMARLTDNVWKCKTA